MRYYGGKARTGKEIAEILKELVAGTHIKGYIEPFCGALGVTIHMTDEGFKCYASDGCKDIILLWKALQSNKFNKKPDMTEKKWLKLKESKIPSPIRAYAGFGCSFGGDWFRAYSQKYQSNGRNQNQESFDSVQNTKAFIKNVKFSHRDYLKHHKRIENGGYLIYCDPPYSKSTNKHKASNHEFDHHEFWNTMRKWVRWGNTVVVSERTAPSDFKCVWSKSLQNSVQTTNKSKRYTDKLFVSKPSKRFSNKKTKTRKRKTYQRSKRKRS